MSEPAVATTPRPPHRHRLALVATVLLIVVVLVALPVALQSVLVELLGAPDNTLYSLVTGRSLTAGRPIAPRQRGTEPQRDSYLNVVVEGLDESTRIATLRLSGQRSCTTDCPAYTLVLVAVDDDATQRAAMPPSASITIKPDTILLNEKVQLPVSGQPSLYPFDRYQLWLGIIAYANQADGSAVPIHPSDVEQRMSLTLQARLARVIMAPPVSIDPASVHVATDPFDFFSVNALAFERPSYLKALTVLLVLLITASGFFAVFMRPVHDLFLGIGGVILGVWGVRSVIVQTSLPYVTAVDLALSAVILLLLLGLAVRAAQHFHRLSELRLPWNRGQR